MNIALASEASIVDRGVGHALVDEALLDVLAPDADLITAHLTRQSGDGGVEGGGLDPEPDGGQVLRANCDPPPPGPQQIGLRQSGRRSNHCASTFSCTVCERRRAATIRSSFDPK